MHKQIKAVVILPDAYTGSNERFAVLYLLHGYSDNYSAWIKKVPEVAALADRYHFIIVCPDGNFGSWYMDSPIDPAWKYETYIAFELTGFVDKNYRTVPNRSGRAITGLSMGGHGALYLAFRHQDIFGAAGSMSGGVDLRPFPLRWDLAQRLGSYARKPENWERNSVINLAYLLSPGSLALAIECGSEDFFFTVNKNLHEKLIERNIPHDFTVRPGAHNWYYWKNAIQYQALFMSRFFEEGQKGTASR